MCTCDTERPGTSQERDHLVQKGAWGLWKSTALSLLPFLCCFTPQHRHSWGHRAHGPFQHLSFTGRSAAAHTRHIKGVCVWSTTSVQSDRFSNPTVASCSCPRSKGLYLLFLGHRFFRTGLQHQVHVLLITQYPVIIHGPSSGESLAHRK